MKIIIREFTIRFGFSGLPRQQVVSKRIIKARRVRRVSKWEKSNRADA